MEEKENIITPDLIHEIYKKTFGYSLDRIVINDDGTTTHLHSDEFLEKHPEEHHLLSSVKKKNDEFIIKKNIQNMKNIKDLLTPQYIDENEQIDESLDTTSICTLIVGFSFLLSTIITGLGVSIENGMIKTPGAIIDDWRKDKKMTKIAKKLSKDEDIINFLKLPEAQQRGKWRNIVRSKLSEEEMKYIYDISRPLVKKHVKS